MGNVLSKINNILSFPLKYYERKRNKKLYKHVFQHDIDEECEEGINCKCGDFDVYKTSNDFNL